MTDTVEEHDCINFDHLATMVHDTAVSKGFWEVDEKPSFDKIAAKLALVHSEVTEILEAIRKSKGSEKICEEFADAIIRLLDLYAALYDSDMVIDSLQEAFNDKTVVNDRRERLHGHVWG